MLHYKNTDIQTVGKRSTKQPYQEKILGKMAKGQKYPALCTADRKISSAFGYARSQDLIINGDVT